MFDQLVESSPNRQRSNKWAFFMGTAVVWFLVVSTVVIIGIATFNAELKEGDVDLTQIAPPPPPPPPPPPAAAPAPKVVKVEAPTGFVAAKEPPKEIKPPSATPPVFSSGDTGAGVAGGVPGGVPGGVLGGVPGSTGPTEAPPPPPPPAPPKEKPPEPPKDPIRRSGGVLQGMATVKREPSYPVIAKAARVMGQVVVEVTIDENGNVIAASAVSGHPLLKDAAVQAARGWKFQPTKLSGVPVKVIGTITFNFQI